MLVQTLSGDQVAKLRSQQLTYDGVGGSTCLLPAGYKHLSKGRTLPSRDFDQLTDAVMSWQVQARSGLRVAVSSQHVEVGAVVVMRLGFSRAALSIPCRVVTVIDEPDRHGFAYGTLPSHPESGEEAFILDRRPDGSVEFTITAFSRPASLLARLSGPVATAAQQFMTSRYLHALG